MARERDYAEENRRREELAYSLGYDSSYQRRSIRNASSPDELKERLQPLIDARRNEGDNQSLGAIYADVYEGYDFYEVDFADVWADMDTGS